MEQEKMFANDVTDEGLTFKIYKHNSVFKNNNNNKKIKKWEDLEFLQRRHTDGEQTYEKVLT